MSIENSKPEFDIDAFFEDLMHCKNQEEYNELLKKYDIHFIPYAPFNHDQTHYYIKEGKRKILDKKKH